MALDFTVKDVIHKIHARFVRSCLPGAKKKYNLRAAFQPELDIHGIASKAEVYNISTSPKVIEEGLKAGMELIHYLAADGYRIKTPVFTLSIRFPGEYDGTENRLNDGLYPEARMRVAQAFREYVKEKVQVEITGIMTSEGCISGVIDEATGIANQSVTAGNLLTVYGMGLKVEGDQEHKDLIGVFFENTAGKRYKAKSLAVNQPKTLKILAPENLPKGTGYRVVVVTQGYPRSNGLLMKGTREIRSDFALAV
jgi:hypothetical protein